MLKVHLRLRMNSSKRSSAREAEAAVALTVRRAPRVMCSCFLAHSSRAQTLLEEVAKEELMAIGWRSPHEYDRCFESDPPCCTCLRVMGNFKVQHRTLGRVVCCVSPPCVLTVLDLPKKFQVQTDVATLINNRLQSNPATNKSSHGKHKRKKRQCQSPSHEQQGRGGGPKCCSLRS